MRNKAESTKAIKLCRNSCVICNWNKTDRDGVPLVEGAHIKPFEADKTKDKFDNIIALCPNHHTMFDHHLFYIDPKTKHTVFWDKNDEFHDIDLSERIKYIKIEYLAYNQYIYEQSNLIMI